MRKEKSDKDKIDKKIPFIILNFAENLHVIDNENTQKNNIIELIKVCGNLFTINFRKKI